MDKTARHIYEFGPFRLIPTEQQLLRDSQLVPLTPKTFDLLVVLVENSGRLIGKDELMEQIWPDSFVEEANLSVKMSALRRALGENPHEIQYIETVPRRGYRFVASVKESWDNGAESVGTEISHGDDDGGAAADSTQQSSSRPVAIEGRRSVFIRRWPLVLGGFLLCSALLFVWNAGVSKEQLLGNGKPVRIESLALLPMENLSGDSSQDYFADGMTEAVITDLSKIGALRVIARPSVMQYKGVQKPLSEIGRELNVDAILTGSVLRLGERVRIAVQLTHVATERNLWANSYERDLRDVLALQKEVTQDIVGEIRIKPPPQVQAQFENVRSVNPEAYDHYLRGKFYLHRQNSENNEIAITALERAVAIDSSFASAHAELAQAYVWKLFLFSPKEQQLAEKAFIAAEKALSLDANLAVAYVARGRLLWTPANHFPHEKAIREYRRALELDPNLDEARNQLALVYCHIGALDEALRESHKAMATNPNNNLAQFRIGETLNWQGKYDQALSVLRAIPQDANQALVGSNIVWSLFNLGRKEEAAATLDQFLRDYPEDNRGLLTSLQAIMAASAGNERAAEEKIKLAIERGKDFGHFHHTAYQIACAYALMNKHEQAIKWLERAAEEGFPCYPLFEIDRSLDIIRGNPRFIAFMGKLRAQWQGYKATL